MNSTPPQRKTDRPPNAATAQRPSIVLPAAIVGLLVVGGAVAYKVFQSPAPPPAPAVTVAPVENKPAVRAIAPPQETAEAPVAPAKAAPVPGTATTAPPPAPAAPSQPAVDPRGLMQTLTGLDLKGPISADDARKWKESLQQLIQQGPSSVNSIREYLAQNLDVSFAGVSGADQLGYSSLRAGLLDALGQIGGADATAAMLQTMQTSVFPTDVATLAAMLEQQSPGQYQSQILSAVRSQLAQAAQGQLGDANVGPLFQVLATEAASGADVSADLSQYSTKWPYYTAIELSALPNGAGLASLMQMAQNEGGATQTAAAQALAQMAGQNAQAASALLAMAQQGQLSDALLNQIAPYLSGRENELGPAVNPQGTTSQGLHIASGNQDFTAADVPLTPAQASQQISVIDQILQALPSGDSQGRQALQQQISNLGARQK